MKISSFHKGNGDQVETLNYWDTYDIAYISKVFTWSPDPLEMAINAKRIVIGGTGYQMDYEKDKLPEEIERCRPDYTLYPQYEYAVGFLTRGCSRRCPYCIVSEKEGKSHKVANLKDFWDGQKLIDLLDPNIMEAPECEELFEQLIASRASISFSQGLDVRRITIDRIDQLKQMKAKKIRFAYDRMMYKDDIENKFRLLKEQTGWTRNKVMVYILTNYETTIEEDLYRIEFIRSLNFQPFVMVYDKKNASRMTREISSWCNRPMFKDVPFDHWIKIRKVKG